MEEFNNGFETQASESERQNYYCNQNTAPDYCPEISEDTKFVEHPKASRTINGLVVFIIMLSFIAVVSILSVFLTLFPYEEENQDVLGSTTSSATSTTTKSNTSTTTRPYDENRPELIISGLPSDDSYSAVEIAEKITPSMVSLMVYQNGVLTSTGSGVIMTEDGYIITCAHIVNSGGDSLYYRVRLYDNTEYDAQVLGYDDKTDIAVVKIDANDLKPAEFASSDYLKSGENILAVGSPGGSEFAGSVTDGIISSPNRYITKGEISNFKVIQHTAAINPGNSGGALVNMYGQVVGINSAKIMALGYEGMGFATSVSYAKIVIDDIIQYGTVVRRARLGVEYFQFDHLSEEGSIVSENKLPPASIVVLNIDKSSDLKNYDVREGDFLIGVNGKKLSSLDVLYDVTYSAVAGDSVTLEFFRVDTKETFEVTCKFIAEN